MKKRFFFLVICSFWMIFLAHFSPAQETSENLLDEIELKFFLAGNPTNELVGFDNPKSSWVLEYELFLTDSAKLEELGRCQRTEDYKLSCLLETSKALDKRVRKISTRLLKGKFKKTQLLLQSNREVRIPFTLPAPIIDIFNKAQTDNSNPTFVLFIKTKASTKTSEKIKFKKKTIGSRVYPLKSFLPDKSFGAYWNVRSFGVSLSIQRRKNVIVGIDIFRN